MAVWEQVRPGDPGTLYADIEGDYRQRTYEQDAAENLAGLWPNLCRTESIG